ncbi:MAG: hypothetical protein CO135_02160 [Candidatus Levybacteria bacterium CG_4_9_14_3_um_filter_35_16]|nr:MAG: hypothetical protein COW87_00770 [Candidatus Levybacteria bacterium CG22_combo_CG10-13_8_21_14_all_35_11]PIY94864.1 MAG: hypothetical protein COY68_01230 [Candidatus Levybacteria bacterium CG_4_10_14_0_8_um_filter_35_23]PJA91265.1 MAG: hypothetical protein CO135_02160 [Candidatus Levybacteria bacterium CG_4_9_14_3_um_filter_35_16]PJC54292.1 MAG: hypothetical protein CO028_03180 [Candidatus Levybacteria bacterium CG_4_9_14_0_2_um_filter_35_21]
MLKNKKLLIPLIVVVLLVLIGGVYLFNARRGSSAPTDIQPTIEVIPTIIPSEIGLSLKASADGKKVIMTITNTKDITGVDYELSYTAKGDLPRGAIGHIDIKEPGESVSQEIVLGTCSDVCHYDQDVKSVKLVVKITKVDGKVYQAEEKLDL